MEPLPIAERPWDSVTMDFIIGLPKSEDNNSIIVVVNRFSKYTTFIAAPTDCTMEEMARLFLKNIVKYWGCLSILSMITIHISLGSFGRNSSSLWGQSFTSPQAFTHGQMGKLRG